MSRDAVEICGGDAQAVIAPYGAELLAWRCNGHERMWARDDAIWKRVSPVLFPVVGWCRNSQIRVAGQAYPMGVHGFAAECVFEMAAKTTSSVTFVLRDNSNTRQHFPFSFELAVTYRLAMGSLSIDMHVRNTGDAVMPYACGVHPGFRWPLTGADRQNHKIEFASEESPDIPVIAPGGLFSTRTRRIPLSGRVLELDDRTFSHEALCFLNARSQSLSFIAPGGERLIVAFEGFPHLALWSRPGAPFLCIEAWTGHGDPVGFEGELRDKPSMIGLEQGKERRHRAIFSIISA